MDGTAGLLKQHVGPLTAHINRLSANVETFDAKYGHIKIAMEECLDKMESHVDGIKERIEKLEGFVHHMKKIQHQCGQIDPGASGNLSARNEVKHWTIQPKYC